MSSTPLSYENLEQDTRACLFELKGSGRKREDRVREENVDR